MSDDGSQPWRPSESSILLHPPTLSSTCTFVPSWSTNRSFAESPDGELFTDETGFMIIALSAFIYSFFCHNEKLSDATASNRQTTPVKNPARREVADDPRMNRSTIARVSTRNTRKHTAHESESSVLPRFFIHVARISSGTDSSLSSFIAFRSSRLYLASS